MSRLTKAELKCEIDDLCRVLNRAPVYGHTAERAVKVIHQLQYELACSEAAFVCSVEARRVIEQEKVDLEARLAAVTKDLLITTDESAAFEERLTRAAEQLEILNGIEAENGQLLDDKVYFLELTKHQAKIIQLLKADANNLAGQVEHLKYQNSQLATAAIKPDSNSREELLKSLHSRESICWETSKMFLDNRDAHGLHDMGVEIQALQRAQAEVNKL